MRPTHLILSLLAGALLLAPPLAAQGFGAGPGGGRTAVALAPLTAEETTWLRTLREEERLARDLYALLGRKWSLTVFANIAEAEERHFAAVGRLLALGPVPDPSAGLAPGTYAFPHLTQLYADLAAKGELSVVEALRAGLAVEAQDIADLEAALKLTTRADLKSVYTRLLNGSYRHADAFTACLEAATPQ